MSALVPAPGVRAPLLPPGKLELRYLFCAQLADGTVYEQTPDDVSLFTPGRSAYFELLEQENGEQKLDDCGRQVTRPDIVLFQLEDGECRWVVDLVDGHFEAQHVEGRGRSARIVGSHFWLAFPSPGSRLRLFYFRKRRHHANAMVVFDGEGGATMDSVVDASQECEYHFGWETEDGKQRAELILV